MTVTAQPARKIISGAGWSNPLSFANVTLESSSHLQVWADDDLLSLGSDYSVSGVGSSSGFTVTIVDEELAPTSFILVLDPTMTQSADLSSGGRFGLAAEAAIDAVVRRMQALEDRVNRAVKAPLTRAVDAADIEVPAYSSGKILAWSSTTDVLENIDAPSAAVAAASGFADAAEGFADDASGFATAAENARDATLAAYDSFDDRYLGAKAADPTLDNDGNALAAGALYFDTVNGIMKLYTGSAWVAAYVSGAGLLAAANNLSDLNNAATALTNLGLTANGAALVKAADYAAMRTLLDLEAGTDFYSVSAAGAAFQAKDDQLSSLVRQNLQNADYTLVATDSGKHIYRSTADSTARAWTIPANGTVPFPVGTIITFDNDGTTGAVTIAITSDTLSLVGLGRLTGSRTLAVGGQATAVKVGTTRWRISGTGLT